MLGGFQASAGGEPIAGLRATAPTRLLAYLALHRGTAARRVYLAGLFWPDGSDLRARRRLSHTLWVLQTALSPVAPTLIQADRDTIGLNPDSPLRIDAEEFEERMDAFDLYRRENTGHLHAETLAATIDMYDGDLLGDYYDEWIEPMRLRLREKFLLGLEHLTQIQKSRREYGAALVSARRLVAETPLSEKAHGELMRLYWLVGRADEAISQYQACSRILSSELGVPPSPDLTALRDRIVSQRRPLTPTAPDPIPALAPAGDDALVGRADARRKALEVVDAAFAGNGGFALIEGQPGIGKTRLLTDVAEAAGWRGSTVLWARHAEEDRTEPYRAITRAMSSVLRGLRREQVLDRLDPEFLAPAGQILPELDHGLSVAPDDAGSPDERYRLHEALTQVLVALGSVSPVMLILEDLHWADTETLEFLRLAAPRLAKSPIAVAISYRTQEARNREDVWNLLTDIEQRQPSTRIPLSGFSRDDIASLAALRTGRSLGDDLIDRLERATGGNPLFVIETLRAMERHDSDSGGVGVIDGELRGRATVDRVLQILLDEIDASPANVRAVVAALAVWGHAAPSAVIARLTGLETAATLDAIRRGIEADYITDQDGDYRLRFEQLASAARENLSPDEAKQLHGRAADVLAEDPSAQAGELASHYRLAERWSLAHRYEAAAGTRAAGLHAYATAAGYFEHALESLELAGEPPSIGLLFGYEAVLDVLARREEQAAILDRIEASELTTPQRAKLLLRRSLFLANTDQLHDAIRVAASGVGFAAATGLDWESQAVTLARVYVVAGQAQQAKAVLAGIDTNAPGATGLAGAQLALGQALTDMQEVGEARELLSGALDSYRRMGDSRGQVEALASLANLHAQHGNTSAALRHYTESIALARQIGSRFGEGMALANLSILEYLQGDAAKALEHLHEAGEVFNAIDHRRGEAMVRANSANIRHAILGDDVLAEREASLARRYFAEIGDRRHEAQCLDVLAGVRRRKRAYAVSRRLAETALEILRETGDHFLEVQALRSLAWTEREAGHNDEARVAISDAVAVATTYELETELPTLLALEAWVLVACGKHDEALASAEQSSAMSDTTSEFREIGAWWRHKTFEALDMAPEAERELRVAHESLAETLVPFDEEDRTRALTRVAEHRAITEAYANRFPRTELVELPVDRKGSEDTVSVEWTVHHPDDLCIPDKKDRRKRRLIRILDEAELAGARPRLEDLAAALDASLSTLKRDLSALRNEGRIA